MEPPRKRQRLTGSSYPGLDLQARKAQNDFRLKSTWESIFEKYGKDFDGIGDEIDMKTGEIVVNNGHIQSMTNERDLGCTNYFPEQRDDSDHEDNASSVDSSEEHAAGPDSFKAGEAAATEESEASELSYHDASSLMGNVLAESRLCQLGKKPGRAVPIPSDDEEDELASSDVEWASHRKDSLGARERRCLLNYNAGHVNELAIESAWRAPPLPDVSLKRVKEKIGPASVDNMREHSDDERAGISLWAPEFKRSLQRRRENTKSEGQSSLSSDVEGMLSDLSDSEPAPGKLVRWTQEEEELLIRLKTTTNLSATAMKPFFPERHCNAIGSHWTHMINRGRDTDRIWKGKISQTGKLPIDKGLSEAESLIRSSRKPIKDLGDYDSSPQCQVGGDHVAPKGYTVGGSDFFAGVLKAHIGCPTGELLSSTRHHGCKIAESADRVHSNEFNADADQLYGLSKPLEIENDVAKRKKDLAPKALDQRLEVASENGCTARSSSASTSINSTPNTESAEPCSNGINFPEIQLRGSTATGALNSPKRLRSNQSKFYRAESVPPTAEDATRRKRSTAERVQRSRSTSSVSTNLARLINSGESSVSHEPKVVSPSKLSVKRQIVQVVIPLAAKSNVVTKLGDEIQSPSKQPDSQSPLATVDIKGPAFIRHISVTTESEAAALGPSLTRRESPATRTPSRSPSVVAAESQFVASTAPILSDVRSSIGPEIADSQPLRTLPIVTTPVPERGRDATRPIIIDAESPPLRLTPSIAPSAGERIQKATETILESDAQPLQVTLAMVTPKMKWIEEAIESDVVESGSHPSGKTFLVARSSLKKCKKTMAGSFASVCPAIDDHSEDELSYL